MRGTSQSIIVCAMHASGSDPGRLHETQTPVHNVAYLCDIKFIRALLIYRAAAADVC
jgi:hypothetical protein